MIFDLKKYKTHGNDFGTAYKSYKKTAILHSLLVSFLIFIFVISSLPIKVKAANYPNLEYFYSNLNKEVIFHGNGFDTCFKILSAWNCENELYYNANLTICNVEKICIDNWAIEFDITGDIVNIWNAEIVDVTSSNTMYCANRYIIKNQGNNKAIMPEMSCSFGFIIHISDIPEKIIVPDDFNMVQKRVLLDEDDYEVSIKVNENTEYNYNGVLVIQNISEHAIEDWELEFATDCDIIDFYTADILEKNNRRYIIKNRGYNSKIESGDSLNIGFVANGSHNQKLEGVVFEKSLFDVRVVLGDSFIPTEIPTEPATSSSINVELPTPSVEPIQESDLNPTLTDTNILDLINYDDSVILFSNNDIPQCVTSDIQLPSEIDGIPVWWESSRDDVIDNKGHVNRPQNESCSVILSAFSKNDNSVLAQEEVKVIKTNFEQKSDAEILTYENYNALFETNAWQENDFSLYENEKGYMDFLYGYYVSDKIESPIEAQKSLLSVKKLMGMDDPFAELEWKETSIYDNLIRFRFKQVYHGVPVYKREVSVICDKVGNAILINSDYISIKEIEKTVIDINSTIVENQLMDYIPNDSMIVENKGLVIYYEDTPNIAWNIVCLYENGLTFEILINANDGSIISENPVGHSLTVKDDCDYYYKGKKYEYRVEKKNGLKYLSNTDRNIYAINNVKRVEDLVSPCFRDVEDKIRFYETYSEEQYLKNQKDLNLVTLRDYFIKSDNQYWIGREKELEMYINCNLVYDFYHILGRDGYDGKKGIMILVDDYTDEDNAVSTLCNSKRWIFINNKIVNRYETMAHEFTHAVIDEETNLNSNGIDGMLHEGYADIFSMLSKEYYNIIEGYSFDTEWTACKNSNGSERYIDVPEKSLNPRAYLDNYYNKNLEDSDNGAHRNSTVVSNLCYRIYKSPYLSLTLKDNVNLWYTSLIIGYGEGQKDFKNLYRNLLTAAYVIGVNKEEIEEIKKELAYSCGISVDDKEIITNSQIEWNEKSNKNYGCIVGEVRNTNNVFVKQAKVSLLDCEHRFDTPKVYYTDKYGKFQFDNLYAGKYILIVDYGNYESFKCQIELGYTVNYDEYSDDDYGSFKEAYCSIILKSKNQRAFNANSDRKCINISVNGTSSQNYGMLILEDSITEEVIVKNLGNDGGVTFENLDAGKYILKYIGTEVEKLLKEIYLNDDVDIYYENILLAEEKQEVCFNIKSGLSDYFIDDVNMTIYEYNDDSIEEIFSKNVNGDDYVIYLEKGTYKLVLKKPCHMWFISEFEVNNGDVDITDGENTNESINLEIFMKPAVEDDELLYGYVWRGQPPKVDSEIEVSLATEWGEKYEFKLNNLEEVFDRTLVNSIDGYASIHFFSIVLPEIVFDNIYLNHTDCIGIVKAYDGQRFLMSKYLYETDFRGEP